MADQQTTLSLILQAKDETTAVLTAVGDKMAQLGREAEEATAKMQRMGFDVNRLDAIKAVEQNLTAATKQGVAERIKAYQDEEQKVVQGFRNEYGELMRQSREARDKAIMDARALRDAKLALLKEETGLDKAERAARAAAIREEANKTMADARADHRELMGLYDEDKKAKIAAQQALTAKKIAPERLQVPAVAAGAEQVRAADALRGVSAAVTEADERFATLKEALNIPPPEALKIARADLQAFTIDLQRDMPALDAFRTGLAQAAAGAGTTAEKLLALRHETETVTAQFGGLYRTATAEIRDNADRQSRVIATALKQQLTDIAAFEKQQLTLIETTSKQIQQLLHAAYSAPGVTDAMKAQGLEMVRDMEAQTQALVETQKRGGAAMRDQAERAAQDARMALKRGLDTELSDLRVTLNKEVHARQEASEQMAVAIHEQAETSKRLTEAFGLHEGAMEKISGPLGHMIEMGRQMVVWNTGYIIWGKITDALAQASGGLVSVNALIEQQSQTFAALYQTSTQAGQAMITSLNKFAAAVPATREGVNQAALAFAAAGDNVSRILQPASDLASIMGTDLPTAAHAMVDAQMGRFEMLQQDLKTNKEELQAYGLQLAGTGQVLNNSFVPAIERYAAARFGEHIAMDAKQAKAAGETLFFTTQQVQQFHRALAVPTTSVAAREIQAGAQIAGGALPAGTPDAQRTAVLTQTMSALTEARSRDTRVATEGMDTLHNLYGLQQGDLDKINKGWRATGDAAQVTFGKWLTANYGGQQALLATQAQQSASERQMKTLTGLFSNVQDAFANLQQVMGQGIFNVLHGQVQNLINIMQSPALLSWAATFGAAMGHGLQMAVTWIGQFGARLGGMPGIIALVNHAWATAVPIIQGVVDALKTAWGILKFLWDVLSTLVGPIRAVVDAFGSLISAGHGADGTWRTLVATLGTLYIAWKSVIGVASLYSDAMKTWKNITDLASKAAEWYATTLKRATEAQQVSKEASDAAAAAQERERVAKEALTTQTGTLRAATEAERVATDESTAALERNTVATHLNHEADEELEGIVTELTGAEEGLMGAINAETDAVVTNTTKTEAMTVATGEQGAAGALGLAAKAMGGFRDALTVTMAFLDTFAGKLLLITADIYLAIKAWQQFQTFQQAGQQKQQLLDIGKELAPVKGTEATLGHLLWQGPPGGTGGAAYIAYTNMLMGRTSEDKAGGTKAFIDYLESHPDVEATYMRYMTGQGLGDRVTQAISAYERTQAAGGGLVSDADKQRAQNYQAYQAALNQFLAAVKHQPAEAMADLDMVKQAYQTYVQNNQTSQTAIAQAMDAANAKYNELLTQVPTQYRQAGGYALPGTPTVSQGQDGAGGAPTTQQLKQQLTTFVATTWAKTLDQIRAGTLDQTDIENAVGQYESLEQQAGVPVTDTKIRDQIRSATKTYVNTLSRQFTLTMKRLRDHVRGVTVEQAQSLVNQIQQLETNVGLADTTGGMQLTLSQWTSPTGPPMAGSPAAVQASVLQGQYNEQKVLLAAFAQKYPGQRQAIQNMIDQLVGTASDPNGLLAQLERAKGIPWARVLEDETTARINLTREYLSHNAKTRALSDAHAQFTLDLGKVGDGTKEYAILLADARRIEQAKLAETHSQTQATAAYRTAVQRADAHMAALAKTTLANDLKTLGTSAQNHTTLLQDAAAVLKWETQAHKDGVQKYLAANQAQDDYNTALKNITKHMHETVATGVAVTMPTALYGPYRPITPQYGATQVSFGGPLQTPLMSLVEQLKAMVSYWQHRALQDERELTLQQRTASATEQTATNTKGMQGWQRSFAPAAAVAPTSTNAGTYLRLRGVHGPVPR